MFKNYQEFVVSYAEFYRGRSMSDSLIDTAAINLFNITSQGANTVSTGSLQYDHDMTGLPLIGSSNLDEHGNKVVIGSFNALNYVDWLSIMTIFMSFIVVKGLLSKSISTSRFIDRLGLRSKDRERLEECIWRLLFYACSSLWLIYSCFMKRQGQLYLGHNQVIAEYSFTLDLDEYLICMIEAGFYLHATYAILFEDVWRRDSPMMLMHHLAAIFSVVGIYATRTHKLGLTIISLRDTCDVLLEVTKLAMCLRIQHDKVVKCLERSVKIFLTIFAMAFVINQLYYYPLFCLYHALNLINMHQLSSPVMTGIITCCLIFLILDLFWFLLIVRLLYRIVFTRAPLKDLREYEDDNGGECKNRTVNSNRKKAN